MIESSSVHPLTTIIADDEKAVDNVLDQLPTLDDVLYRHSQPPVCLYNYYIVLRDRLQLEMWLDFWLDVAQADILYKRYLKYQRSTKKVMSVPQLKKPSIASSLFSNSDRNDILTHMLLLQPRASLANTITSTATTKRTPPPTQMEMIECVERIYLRYIVPSAEKELVQLPIEIKQRIHQYFSLSNVVKDNPAVYAEAKEYVHHLLETITFPLFLRYKVFMNLTLPQQIGRLAAGLFLLLFGFSLEFSLIFLDIRPWQKRLWGILPIILGVFCVVTSISGIDPIWVLVFNSSETVPFHFNRIIQYKVKEILRKRSIIVSCIIFSITFIFMTFFCALAGKRL